MEHKEDHMSTEDPEATEEEYLNWRAEIVACKQAIMKNSEAINPKNMDGRLDEILTAHILAEIMRRGVAVTPGDEKESINVGVPVTAPEEIKNMINNNGPTLARIYFNQTTTVHKDQMVELSATVMLCCQLLIAKICSKITTEEDRYLMAAASSELIQDTILSMLKAINNSDKDALVASVT